MAGRKILVVDDDQDLLKGVVVRLRASGYDVAFAVDAISAISEVRKEKPDLIVLDIGLPGGDGYVVMERLKNLLIMTPIVILTAKDPVIHRERSMRAGAAAFFQKPADNVEFLAAIQRILEEESKRA